MSLNNIINIVVIFNVLYILKIETFT